jgi:hypothetical protein
VHRAGGEQFLWEGHGWREGATGGARLALPQLFFFRREAIVADTADLGAGDGDADIAISGDLLFELFVEAGLKFADFATAQAGDVDVVSGAVGFVVVAVAAEVQKVELVDEALTFEQVYRAVDGDQVDFGIDSLGALEDLIDVEMLLGGVHDLKDNAALTGEADLALAESVLEVPGGFGGVDAFARRDAARWRGGHGESLAGTVGDGNRAGKQQKCTSEKV